MASERKGRRTEKKKKNNERRGRRHRLKTEAASLHAATVHSNCAKLKGTPADLLHCDCEQQLAGEGQKGWTLDPAGCKKFGVGRGGVLSFCAPVSAPPHYADTRTLPSPAAD
jgi:hypothetical protein